MHLHRFCSKPCPAQTLNSLGTLRLPWCQNKQVHTAMFRVHVSCCTSCDQICYAPHDISLLPGFCFYAWLLAVIFWHDELSNREPNICCRAHTSSSFQCKHSHINGSQAAAWSHKYTAFWYTWPANLCGIMGKSKLCKSD